SHSPAHHAALDWRHKFHVNRWRNACSFRRPADDLPKAAREVLIARPRSDLKSLILKSIAQVMKAHGQEGWLAPLKKAPKARNVTAWGNAPGNEQERNPSAEGA